MSSPKQHRAGKVQLIRPNKPKAGFEGEHLRPDEEKQTLNSKLKHYQKLAEIALCKSAPKTRVRVA
jgi:hypothetical protein